MNVIDWITTNNFPFNFPSSCYNSKIFKIPLILPQIESIKSNKWKNWILWNDEMKYISATQWYERRDFIHIHHFGVYINCTRIDRKMKVVMIMINMMIHMVIIMMLQSQ